MRHADDHPDPNARLNLLLSYGGWREHAAVRQLPRLLEPMGIHALQADTGEEAASLIQHQPVHIAVVDLEIPLTRCGSRPVPGGARILQLLRRLDQPPPDHCRAAATGEQSTGCPRVDGLAAGRCLRGH